MTPVCAHQIVLATADNVVVVMIAAHSVLVSAEMTLDYSHHHYCGELEERTAEVETAERMASTSTAVEDGDNADVVRAVLIVVVRTAAGELLV